MKEYIIGKNEAGHNAGMRVCAVFDEYSVYIDEEKHRKADYYINDFIDISLSEDFCDSTPTGFEANRISSSSYMTSRRNPVLLICRGPPVNLFMVSSDINILTLSFSFNISLPLAFFPFRTIFLFLNCLKMPVRALFLNS